MTLKVIGAGLGRTGTFSLKFALEKLLDEPCYHMFELMKRPQDLPTWKAALDGESHDWSVPFSEYGAAVDYPVAYFWEEILAAYPDAKVILTVRDPESWYDSAKNTIYKFEPNTAEKLSIGMRWLFKRSLRTMVKTGLYAEKLVWKTHFEDRFDDKDFAISVFEKHNSHVRDTVPAERLLEFNVKEGWGPLCDFLGTPVPDAPFPHENERAAFAARRKEMMG